MAAYALTTVDNPYDPFDQFSSWFTYDVLSGHNTCDRLARSAFVSDSLSDAEYEMEIERAIDSIIESDPENKYRKVKQKTETNVS
jgi:hypothetical protein